MASVAGVGAAESAGAASAVIGAGASSIPSSGGAGDSGQDTGALLSDDSILGITEGGDTGTVDTQQTAPPAAVPGTEAELGIDDFKALFPQNPKLQSLWDKYDNNNKLVTQFGTVADARKAAETVQMLGGVEHLATVAQRAADFDKVDATFFGGKPEDRAALATSWYDQNAGEGVAKQLNATLDVMQQRDPQRYVEHLDTFTRKGLDAVQFSAYLANIAKALESGQGLDDAAKQLLGMAKHYRLDSNAKTTPSPELDKLSQKEKALDQREQNWNQQQENATLSTVNAGVRETAASEIDKALSELKVNGRPVFGHKSVQLRTTIQEKIEQHAFTAVQKNPVLIAQIASLAAKGIIGKEKELTDLNLRFLRLQLPASVEAVMKPWTDSVVGQAAATSERVTRAAGRVDVGSGGISGGGTKTKLTPEKAKGMTEDAILDF